MNTFVGFFVHTVIHKNKNVHKVDQLSIYVIIARYKSSTFRIKLLFFAAAANKSKVKSHSSSLSL